MQEREVRDFIYLNVDEVSELIFNDLPEVMDVKDGILKIAATDKDAFLDGAAGVLRKQLEAEFYYRTYLIPKIGVQKEKIIEVCSEGIQEVKKGI